MEAKIYKAVIFDLDGVICHTDMFHYRAWKEIADSLGIPFDEEKNNRLRGVSRMESLEMILAGSSVSYSRREKEAICARKNSLYRSMLKSMTPADVDPAVRRMLEELGADYRIAIGSSSRNATFILEKIGLLDMFDAISDGNNIKRSKPDPEVFRNAADMLGLSPYECLVVEDAESGIEAAGNGGFDSAAIGDAKGCARATYRLDSLLELPAILGRR